MDTVPTSATVLDVGAWGKPFTRADIVLDHMPYETRGLYGRDGAEPERFNAQSWIVMDICDRTPWPLEDNSIDFAVCSHTLEDVRDPIWVCHELARVAKAGYIEVPSRLEEQSIGVQGPWVGWGHHRWLIDVRGDNIDFVLKHHIIHSDDTLHFPAGFHTTLTPEDRVERLWWEGAFTAHEVPFTWPPADLLGYMSDFVGDQMKRRGFESTAHNTPATVPDRSLARRLRSLSGRVLRKNPFRRID